jgi:hypothetical protein
MTVTIPYGSASHPPPDRPISQIARTALFPRAHQSGPMRRPRGRLFEAMKLPNEIGPIHFVGIGGIGMSGIVEVHCKKFAPLDR